MQTWWQILSPNEKAAYIALIGVGITTTVSILLAIYNKRSSPKREEEELASKTKNTRSHRMLENASLQILPPFTFGSIQQEIRRHPQYFQDDAASRFVGIVVDWVLPFSHPQKMEDGSWAVFFKASVDKLFGQVIVRNVDLEEHSIFKFLHGDELFRVKGTIISAGVTNIFLKDASFELLKDNPSKEPSSAAIDKQLIEAQRLADESVQKLRQLELEFKQPSLPELIEQYADVNPYSSIEAFFVRMASFGNRIAPKRDFLRTSNGRQVVWQGVVSTWNVDSLPRRATVSFYSKAFFNPDTWVVAHFLEPDPAMVDRIKSLNQEDNIRVSGVMADGERSQIDADSLEFLKPAEPEA